ncbi:MAG: TetR/AcrR family transcriptional regulator [Pseudomonadota bacterium]
MATTAYRQQVDEERKHRTRARLIDAARRVFVAQGYHAPKISDIVTEAGSGQGTFYRHFADKREIFDALVDEVLVDLAAGFNTAFATLPENVEEYRDASLLSVHAAAHVLMEYRAEALLFLKEGPTIDANFEARVTETMDGFASLAQGFLDHAIRAGFARPCDSAVVAQCLVGIALRHLERGLPDGIDLNHTVREIVDFAFLGFGPAQQES